MKEGENDPIRELVDWALAEGRRLQSGQTSYFHFNYGEPYSTAQTIPFYENLLFVLALFRSRIVEQMQEAKGMLKRMLILQNKEEGENFGNFPVYLHQYPDCQDPSLCVQALAPLYWISRDYAHVLGGELKEKLHEASEIALECGKRLHRRKPFPYPFAVRLAAAQIAYGVIWNRPEWCEEGRSSLEELAISQLEGWQTTKQLSDILIALQMVYPSLAMSPWLPLWQHMERTWHHHLCCYVGPCTREWQDEQEPKANLYDLYGGLFSGKFSSYASKPEIHHLHGILIQPSADRFNLENIPSLVSGSFKGQSWKIVAEPSKACTLLEKKGPYQPAVDKTYTFYRFIHGDSKRIHTLVCQGGNVERVFFKDEGKTMVLEFDLREQHLDDGAPTKELEFFLDVHPDVEFLVQGQRANTFRLGETLRVKSGEHILSFTFNLIRGEGTFLGHLMRGNRPSQLANKGEKRFQSYDWTFFVRNIRSKGECTLQVIVSNE